MRISPILRDLSLIARKLRKLFDAQVSARNLTMSRARILVFLAETQATNQTELARELDVEQATVVRLVDRMEKHGLVERTPDPDDRRSKHIRLTDAARPHLDSVDEVIDNLHVTLLRDIEDADLKVFEKVLAQMAKNVDAEGATKAATA